MDTILIILLSIICVLLIANGAAYYLCLTLSGRQLQKSIDTLDIYRDARETFINLTKEVERIKRIQKNHTKLILKSFIILKDSIEKDLTREQVLQIITDLNLPLEENDKVKEVTNARDTER